MLEFLKELEKSLENIVNQLCKLVEMGVPVAQTVAPFTGQAAPAVMAASAAAGIIATAVDAAIPDDGAPHTPETATAALAGIAQAVAASGLLSTTTADKVKIITGSLTPEIRAMLENG
jgi:hypothetical protein